MSVAHLFPGQGSQYVGMAKDFFAQFALAREVFEEASDAIKVDFRKLIFDDPDKLLDRTDFTQPAVFTVNHALLTVCRKISGLAIPAVTLGHSLGEYNALTASGVVGFADALKIVRTRGESMHLSSAKIEGGIAAVIGGDTPIIDALIAEILDDSSVDTTKWKPLAVANYNSPGQTVITGLTTLIDRFAVLAPSNGIRKVVKLKVSVPVHSELLKPYLKEFFELIEAADFGAPGLPVIANLTAKPYSDSADEIRRTLIAHSTSPVRWIDSVNEAVVTYGVDTFIEIGPGSVLTGLVKRISPEAKLVNIGTVEDLKKIGC